MIMRTILIGAAALVVSATSASSQGKSTKPVVISKTVLKSMVANKPKTKTQLGARAGIVRRKNVVATKPASEQPASVREIAPLPKRH